MTNADPVKKASNINMNKPLCGSEAKECTEINTPERTKKVPKRLREKAVMARRILKPLNSPLFSVTMRECINAVATNQGISEAFSTGSQNHQPPQPNS